MFNEAGFEVVGYESRSGIFEFADPIGEIWLSLSTLKKRFFTNLIKLNSQYPFYVEAFVGLPRGRFCSFLGTVCHVLSCG
jgi:hypothetical protein